MGSNITDFQDNVIGVENKSRGIELATKWTNKNKLNIRRVNSSKNKKKNNLHHYK